jgi:predicted AlkP superfamily phosphohydrolase/phosphomutase
LQSKVATDGIDWSRTTAFHRGKGEGNIYLNLRGRDPHGIVPEADYDTVRSSIIAGLLELRDPATGAAAVRAVHRREDVFTGDLIDSAPDLIVEWDDFKYMPSEQLDSDGKVFGPRIREYMNWPTTGSHRAEGFLMIRGNDVRTGTLDEPVDLMDLAPTWIELLGSNAPSTMQGKSVLGKIRVTRQTAGVMAIPAK